MLKSVIKSVVEGKNLTEEEMIGAMNVIMEGNATQAQIGSFITALRIKGETVEEITGGAKVMRAKAEPIVPDLEYFIDTVGTGGDGTNTFNISTASAIVASAGGVHVAKHGNRAVSSKSGSADVLEALGVNILLTPEQAKDCLQSLGICFMFAPTYHKSMKHAAGPRKELGIRTIFNVLGPLTNPARAKGEVLGVFDRKLTEPMANVLLNLGIEKAMVIHGIDGMDEITTTTSTKVSEVLNGKIINYEITPEEYGIKRAEKADLLGGDALENANIVLSVLSGDLGPKRDIVVLNSAAALYVGKIVRSIKEGVKMSENIIDMGLALKKLGELTEFTQKSIA